MHVRIDHLDANPFRHIDRYPIREDKITALMESINSTGFWDNMVGRVVGDRVQIAYGHHRREALRRAYPPDHEIGIVVRDFDDDQMLKIMARENMEEWGSSAAIEHETVRAVVEAYGVGQIQLEEPDRLARAAQLRYAPSFVTGHTGDPGRPYTAKSVARFLGWLEPSGEPQAKVVDALAALALIEKGDLTDAQFAGLGTKAARALVRETHSLLLEQERQREVEAKRLAEIEAQRQAAEERAAQAAEERAAALARAKAAQEQAERDQAEREFAEQNRRAQQAEQDQRRAQAARESAEREVKRREAERTQIRKEVASTMQTNLRDANMGIDRARGEARQVRARHAPDNTVPPDLGRTVRTLASVLVRNLEGGAMSQVDDVIKLRQHIPDADRDQLIEALLAVREHATRRLHALGYAEDRDGHPVDIPDVIDAELV